MDYLGRRWAEVQTELQEKNQEHSCNIIYSVKREAPSGDLRVVRVRESEGRLTFTLMHERYER